MKRSDDVIPIPLRERDLILSAFNKKQPAASGFAEFTLERSEGLSRTGTLFH
jgi:hypothetical protein